MANGVVFFSIYQETLCKALSLVGVAEVISTNQESPNYGPRAKPGPQSHFVNIEKIIYLLKIC